MQQHISKAIAFIMAIITFLVSGVSFLVKKSNTVTVNVDCSAAGEVLPNIASNVNQWDMGTMFYSPEVTSEYNVFDFVEYVQLMQCTGGTYSRDLFKDPYDTSVLDDYDFTRLIENCRGILSLGAKPHLKLGGVPMKYTSGAELGGFDMNVYPPDDYNVYYNYIKAAAEALVEAFGKEEVLSWRFGCMTEYENYDWFQAKSGKPEDSMIAYCKLYDYTVQALIDVLGEDVFVGAHSMSVTEGGWDEAEFIKHVAQGTNYANGKTGTKVSFLSASYYDINPGQYTSGKTLPETIAYLRNAAEKYGLKDVIFGVDEGRILNGNLRGAIDAQVLNRTVGYTWQGAYDARLFKQAIDSDMDYFSSWGLLSGGLFSGNPTVSYYVLSNLAAFAGSKKLDADVDFSALGGKESDCLAAFDEESGTLRLMVYNFKNDVDYDKALDMNIALCVPQFDGKTVKIVKKVIGDDCNWFDEWQADRVTYGITDDKFGWSPDDPCVENRTTLQDAEARELYLNELMPKYKELSRLVPEETELPVTDGVIELSSAIEANNVIFYEISAK